jgi:hypothetical protein
MEAYLNVIHNEAGELIRGHINRFPAELLPVWYTGGGNRASVLLTRSADTYEEACQTIVDAVDAGGELEHLRRPMVDGGIIGWMIVNRRTSEGLDMGPFTSADPAVDPPSRSPRG